MDACTRRRAGLVIPPRVFPLVRPGAYLERVRTRPESSPADSSYWPCRIKIKCLRGAPEGFNRERRRPRLSSSLWSQLQSHWGQGTAGWKSWASMARSATAVSRRWTAGARSSALGRDVGRTARPRVALRGGRGGALLSERSVRACNAARVVAQSRCDVRALALLAEHSAFQGRIAANSLCCDSAVRK